MFHWLYKLQKLTVITNPEGADVLNIPSEGSGIQIQVGDVCLMALKVSSFFPEWKRWPNGLPERMPSKEFHCFTPSCGGGGPDDLPWGLVPWAGCCSTPLRTSEWWLVGISLVGPPGSLHPCKLIVSRFLTVFYWFSINSFAPPTSDVHVATVYRLLSPVYLNMTLIISWTMSSVLLSRNRHHDILCQFQVIIMILTSVS